MFYRISNAKDRKDREILSLCTLKISINATHFEWHNTKITQWPPNRKRAIARLNRTFRVCWSVGRKVTKKDCIWSPSVRLQRFLQISDRWTLIPLAEDVIFVWEGWNLVCQPIRRMANVNWVRCLFGRPFEADICRLSEIFTAILNSIVSKLIS